MNLSNLLPFSIFRRPRPAPGPKPIARRQPWRRSSTRYVTQKVAGRERRVFVFVKASRKDRGVWSQAEVEIMRQAA